MTTWTSGRPGVGRYYEAADVNGHRVTIYAPRAGEEWTVWVGGELQPGGFPDPAAARAAGEAAALALPGSCYRWGMARVALKETG